MHFSVTDLPVPEPPMMTRLSPGIDLQRDAGEHRLGAEALRRRGARSAGDLRHQKKASVRM